jgi:hypothetical protein
MLRPPEDKKSRARRNVELELEPVFAQLARRVPFKQMFVSTRRILVCRVVNVAVLGCACLAVGVSLSPSEPSLTDLVGRGGPHARQRPPSVCQGASEWCAGVSR